MKVLLKSISWMLQLLTVLFLIYFAMLLYNVDMAMDINESFYLYIYIQTIHVFCSLSALFVIWSNDLYDKWKKIDQTLLIVFLSIIGLWIWFLKFYPQYVKRENDTIDD